MNARTLALGVGKNRIPSPEGSRCLIFVVDKT